MFGLTMTPNHPERVRAVVILEPSLVPDCDAGSYRALSLIVLGDFIDGDARWPRMREPNPCVHTMFLPALGLRGNSHMRMIDRNNLHVADLVHAWLAIELTTGAHHLAHVA